MSETLGNVLQDIAAYINQDPTLPTGTDLTMWTNLVNQSQDEWSDSFIFRKELTRPFAVQVQASQTSIGLPYNFERLLTPLVDARYQNTEENKYYEILPIDRFYKNSTDKYCYRLGDQASGISLQINPPLASGASIVFSYLAMPSSMVSLNDTITCQSKQFLVLRTISKILSARSDPRFPQVRADSDEILSHLEDDEAAATGGQDNQTPRSFQRKGLRIGEF